MVYSPVDDPEEMVVGFFGACNVTEKRIFITAAEADWYITPPQPPPPGPPDPPCKIRTVTDSKLYFGQLGWVPLDEIWDTRDNGATYFFVGYTAVEKLSCAHCGPNYIKPLWWQ